MGAHMLGFLFDLDGTLAHTNPTHERAWRSLLREYGVELSSEEFVAKVSGRSNVEIVGTLLPQLDADAGQRVADAKEALFRELATDLQAPGGVVALVKRAYGEGLKLAVVTNAPNANVVHVLRQLGLEAEFRVLVCAEDVTAPKPDPTPYLTAAARLGLQTNQCLAFEDSPSGIEAAHAAGIPVVGLMTSHGAEELLAAGAEVVAKDCDDPAFSSWLARHLTPPIR